MWEYQICNGASIVLYEGRRHGHGSTMWRAMSVPKGVNGQLTTRSQLTMHGARTHIAHNSS